MKRLFTAAALIALATSAQADGYFDLGEGKDTTIRGQVLRYASQHVDRVAIARMEVHGSDYVVVFINNVYCNNGTYEETSRYYGEDIYSLEQESGKGPLSRINSSSPFGKLTRIACD